MMIRHHVYSWQLYFTYLQQVGVILNNPLDTLQFPRPTKKQRVIFTEQEIQLLHQHCTQPVDFAILAICYGAGLRRSEAIALNVADVQPENNVLYVREGKNSKRRVVALSSGVSKIVQSYLLQRNYLALPNETAFIVNSYGSRTSGGNLNKLFKQLIQRAGIQKLDASLHSLRASISIHLFEKGMQPEKIQGFLGHKSLDTSFIYIRLNKNNLKILL